MSNSTKPGLTRRSLLGGLGAGAGAMGLAAMTPVQAALLPDPEITESFDVVVVGSGLSGCVAALEAAQSGARVIVLEKASQSRMGGNSLMSAGYFAVPSADTAEGRQAYIDEWNRLTDHRGNAEIFALMAAAVREDLAWLDSHGIETIPFPPSMSGPIGQVFAAPAPLAGMMSLFRTMRQRLADLGVTLVFDTKARQLIMDENGAVVGVRASGQGGLVDFRGRAVVIAAGGYSGNLSILEAYTHPDAGALKVSGIPHATGDGLLMAQQAGAGLRGMGGLNGISPVPVDPVETTGGLPFPAIPYTMAVNSEGLRFADEALGYPFLGTPIFEQPGRMASLIFDHTIRQNPAVDSGVGTFTRLGLTVHSAASLEELAGLIGVPAEALIASVEAFNAAIENGAAPSAIPPKTADAYPVTTAPFYAFSPLVPGILLTYGGIMINGKAQVLEPDGRIIAGLYAAGEGAGAAFHHGYITGGSLANCLVMGRTAGRQAITASTTN